MKVFTLLLILVIFLLLNGCYTVSKFASRPAYIKFSGNIDDVTLLIDDVDHGLLLENRKKNYVYKYTPGVHQITLLRNEVVIIKTTVDLKKGKTTEMNLP